MREIRTYGSERVCVSDDAFYSLDIHHIKGPNVYMVLLHHAQCLDSPKSRITLRLEIVIPCERK